MDAKNRFETRATFLLLRMEWLGGLVVCAVLAVRHFSEIRWGVFISLFVVIDAIGYLPGALAFRRSPDGRISRWYFVAYNTMHSLVTAGVLAGVWAVLVTPEWALLALPLHLLGTVRCSGIHSSRSGCFSSRMRMRIMLNSSGPIRIRPGVIPVSPGGVRMPSVFENLVRHSDNPSSFLALNQGNEYFRDPRFDGTCVYRRSGRHLLQFAGPFAAEEQRADLLDAFAAQARPRRLVAVQLQRADAELYGAHGFTVNQLGASYAVDLGRFTLRGSAFVRLRNKISRARRAGLEVVEAPSVADDEVRNELDLIDRAWLRGKGGAKELRFLVGSGPGWRSGTGGCSWGGSVGWPSDTSVTRRCSVAGRGGCTT